MNWKAKKFYLPLCAAAFTTIAVNGGALADSISLGPESFLTNSIDSSMFGSNEFSDTLTFDLFDGNLGTLTGVSMEIDYLHDSFLDVGGLEGGHGTSNHQGQISFALLSVANEVVFSDDLDAACSGSFASCDDSVFGGVSTADFLDLIGVSGPSLASFTGTETFDVVFNTITNLSFCEGNFSETATCFAQTFWGGDLSVEYTYTPVAEEEVAMPEPAALGLFGLGLAGLGLLRRRRKPA